MTSEESLIYKECSFCHGTGKSPLPSRQQQERAAGALIGLALASAKLKDKTDAQLAHALECYVWPALSMARMGSNLIDEAIERLRRSGGGARVTHEP